MIPNLQKAVNSMDNKLRIKVGKTVVDVNEFEFSELNGVLRLDITGFRIHGGFDTPVSEPVQNERPKEVKEESRVITREQIDKEIKK